MGLIATVGTQNVAHQSLTTLLQRDGHEVTRVESLDDLIEEMLTTKVELVVVLIDRWHSTIVETVAKLLASDPNLQIIFLPEQDSEVFRRECFDDRIGVVPRPYSVESLLNVVDRALRGRKKSMQEQAETRSKSLAELKMPRLLGSSPRICRVNLLINKIAKSSTTPALLVGESGTGKEVAAEVLHYMSPRANAPFVKLNCAAIPSALIEDELFGHERGSFTSAQDCRIGLFELADGGTLLLDEIGEMDTSLQPKLLRVLQDKVIRRIGSTKDRRVDVRVIAATNRKLEKMCREGTFREDLYFRLAVLKVELPSLRERPEDIPMLAEHFLKQKCSEVGKRIFGFSNEVMAFFLDYDWPGNVRELINMVERLVILAESSTIDFSRDELELHTFARSRGSISSSNLGHEKGSTSQVSVKASKPMDSSDIVTLDEVEKDYIRVALEALGFNKSRAARKLGISRSTLRRKISVHNLTEWVDEHCTDD